MLTARLHGIIVAPSPSPEASPDRVPLAGTVLISRHRIRNTSDVAHATFSYVAERFHAATFDWEPLYRILMPVDKRMSKYRHLGTTECQIVMPGSIQHRDRHVKFSRADEVYVHDAIQVRASVKEPSPRSRFAEASRRLQHREPVPPPKCAATGLTPHMREKDWR